MIGAMATGTKTITSIDVHAEKEPGRILLGAHPLVRGAFRSSGGRKASLPADKHIHGPGIRLCAGGRVAATNWRGRETSGIRAAHKGFAAAVHCAATVTGK